MNSLLHRDNDDDDVEDRTPSTLARDREITLGTTMILGIFFALAVFAAVFFGFGYSMGVKHAVTTATLPAETAPGSLGGFKPSPSNPLGAAVKQPVAEVAAVPYTPPSAPLKTAPKPVDPDAAVVLPTPTTPAATARTAHPDTAAPVAPAAPVAINPAATPGQTIVQIAAFSHQEDADLVLTTLKRRGYAVSIRQEPQDKLLHVQIGPFTTRKDADAMRQRLLADGFNAIVKDAGR